MDRVISMAERNTERFGTVESSGRVGGTTISYPMAEQWWL